MVDNILLLLMPTTTRVLINGGGWEPLKETDKRGRLNEWGGQKFAKNGFLHYLLETSAQ